MVIPYIVRSQWEHWRTYGTSEPLPKVLVECSEEEEIEENKALPVHKGPFSGTRSRMRKPARLDASNGKNGENEAHPVPGPILWSKSGESLFPISNWPIANDHLGRLFLRDPASEEDSSTNTIEDSWEMTEADREWMTTVLGLPARNDIISLVSDDDEGPQEVQTEDPQTGVKKHRSPMPGPSGLKRTRSSSSLPETYTIPAIESKNNPWSSKRARYSY